MAFGKQVEKKKEEISVERYCMICGKHFTSSNSFTNHLQSKRHKDLEAKMSLTDEQRTEIQSGLIKDPKPKDKTNQVAENMETDKVDDKENNWEDIADEDDILKDYGLPNFFFSQKNHSVWM
jgi:hypothetical protein